MSGPRAGGSGEAPTAVAPSRGIVRTGGVAQPTTPPGGPLGRSGLDLLDVLGSTDSLVTRSAAAPLAMEIGLEQARGSLVRQMPGDALAALDAVWEGAQRTEEGWFLRSGALLVLGLPGECERVTERGLEERPQSTALRFAQSLARLAVGDPAGARAALQAALQRLPSDPLLLAHHAVVLATQGDSAGAEAALRAAGRRVGSDDPAVQYGRDGVNSALRASASDRARQGAVSVAQGEEIPADFGAPEIPTRAMRDVTARDVTARDVTARDVTARDVTAPGLMAPSTGIASATSGRAHHDPITVAVQLLGSQLRGRDVPALVREIRVLLRSLSAGGPLGTSGRPEQAHAARTLLALIASSLTGEETDAPPAKRALVGAVLTTLRSGYPDDVARAMRPLTSASPMVGESFAQLLHALVDGAQSPVADSAPEIFADIRASMESASGLNAGTQAARPVVQDASQGVIVPVRLGLRLIDETPESRAQAAPAFARVDERPSDSFARQAFAEVPSMRQGLSEVSSRNAEATGTGWGAAAASAALTPHDHAESGSAPRTGQGYVVRMAAVSCIVIAAVAATRGYSAVAVACGIGAAWLALRRSGGDRRNKGEWSDTADWPSIPANEVAIVRDFERVADEDSGRR